MASLTVPAALQPTEDFARLADVARRRMDLDLRAYYSAQLLRRIGYFCAHHGIDGHARLAQRLENDPALCAAFADHLTINVTQFFRDGDRFEHLARTVLPELLAGRRPLHAWSAGCSIGAEVYTLAMILAETARERRHVLLATDIDRRVLARAQAATYSADEVKGVPAGTRARFLQAEGELWRVVPAIRGWVRVLRHDLLSDAPPAADLDLILCRNVVIYFTPAAKDQLYRRLAAALRPGGYLFVGATEALFAWHELGLETRDPGFYRKKT